MTHRHRPEHIAVGTDGSLNAHAAIRWAVDHAQPGDTVTLVHSWEAASSVSDPVATKTDPSAAARIFIDRECARANALPHAERVSVCGEVVEGDPKDCLESVRCDLLVVGARGHNRVAELLLGSVTSHLVQHCHRPLVIVPHG